MKYVPIIARVLLTVAFVLAGGAKLAGAEPMVATFDAIGVGQWFRYVTGAIEVVGAAMLWIGSLRLLGALLLGATMVGAIIAHLAILGPSPIPAAILGLLTLVVIYFDRRQMS